MNLVRCGDCLTSVYLVDVANFESKQYIGTCEGVSMGEKGYDILFYGTNGGILMC